MLIITPQCFQGYLSLARLFILSQVIYPEQGYLSCSNGVIMYCFNTLPNDNILDWYKLKAFADDKLKLA